MGGVTANDPASIAAGGLGEADQAALSDGELDRLQAARDQLVDVALAALGGSTLLDEDDPDLVAARITGRDVERARLAIHFATNNLLGVLFDHVPDEA